MNDNNFKATEAYARQLDQSDPLKDTKNRFEIPKDKSGNDTIYLCGNSLGLMPSQTRDIINQELKDWATYGVEGHFEAKIPWFSYHENLAAPMARIVGAEPSEVVIMNSLTTNLHLLMVSFYRPTKARHKILIDYSAFPSDQYAVASQLRYHGYDPEDGVIELIPDQGEIVSTSTIIRTIEDHKDELALVMLGGVNYYTGQAFEISKIAAVANRLGITIGLDLAHAAGNIPLQLHDDNIDFAAWCSYKYINSGPGSLSGIFIHKKHHNDSSIPRFEGWWGHDKDVRFKMEDRFVPIRSAEAWQLSNPPILSMAAVYSSLQIFDEVGFDNLVMKSTKLTSFLEFLLVDLLGEKISLLTPSQPNQRGAQLSIVVKENGKAVYDQLSENGVICDWREPSVIRVAPVPLYNTYTDVYRFVKIMERTLNDLD